MERLGKYEIRALLGRGAMGTVYEGWDPRLARRVAIKTVRLPDGADREEREQLDRFRKEAQAAGRLHHPNIVGVFDYGEADDLAYIVMEFVSGRTLKTVLENGIPPDLAEIGRLMDGLLTGLDYSHSHQVIHRDIKPANVIITAEGVVKIADFGIARVADSTMTQVGTIMGTPAYMSPEQFQGVAIDARTDIYSAGVVLFQLLTGRRPFEGSITTIMNAVLSKGVPRLSGMSRTISVELDAIVARAMARAPENRFPSASAFNEALQAALGIPVLASNFDDLPNDDATIIASTHPMRWREQTAASKSSPLSSPSVPHASATPRSATPRSRWPMRLAGAALLLAIAGSGTFWVFNRPGSVPDAVTAPVAPSPAAPPPFSSSPTGPISAPQKPLPPAPPGGGVTAESQQPDLPRPLVTPPSAPAEEKSAMPAPSTPPLSTALAVPSREAIRQAIAAAVQNASCSVSTGDDRLGGGATLRGVVGRGRGETALRRAVQEAAPGIAIEWQLTPVDGPYCAVLDTLRPYARPFGSIGKVLDLALVGGRTDLVAHERILPRVTMPDFVSYLQLDYFAGDGTVEHLHQSLSTISYVPLSTPTFGEPSPPGFLGWEVFEPFGTDLIVGIASSAPLFRSPRPEDDKLDDYLRDLRVALDKAVRGGTRVSAAVLVIRTSP